MACRLALMFIADKLQTKRAIKQSMTRAAGQNLAADRLTESQTTLNNLEYSRRHE